MRGRIIVLALLVGVVVPLLWHPWDRDGDGSWNVLRASLDCDDDDARVAPGFDDTPFDGIDENCDGRDSYEGANVVFILVDALRPDVLGPYGGDSDDPAITRLAAESWRYTDVVAQSSCTKPSMPSMLASRLPSQLYPTLFAPETQHVPVALPRGVRTLPEILREHGYETVGFAANPLLQPRWGSQQGFSEYRFLERPCTGFENYATATTIREMALNWLDRYKGKRPFFLYLHLMDVHTRPCQLKYQATVGRDLLRRQYRERVAYADKEIGRVVEAIRQAPSHLDRRTIVVLTADHGEELGEHKGSRHCQTLFEETIRIPLFVRLPGGSPAGVVTTSARGLDIVPTILSLVGVPFEAGEFVGQVLPPFGGDDGERPLGGQGPRQAALRHGDWKLIDVYADEEAERTQYGGARVMLFNLADDPGEQVNLSERHPEQVAELRRRLADVQGLAAPAHGIPLDNDERATLRALGYIE